MPQQYTDYINQYQRDMQIHNATHDFTEKDASLRTWHDLKERRQLNIFDKQEQRRRRYEHAKFKEACWDIVKYVLPVFAALLICYCYSNELQAFLEIGGKP